nr:MAG TPA: hypothetical protein [Caudoviricetes sp.]
MGLYVILEGESYYNEDVEPIVTEEDLNNFNDLMKSDQAFNLDSDDEPKQTVKDTEKIVQDIEKKMIESCKKHIENSDSTEKLPFLERIKHRLENSLSICEERINKVRNKNYDNESFTTKIKDQAIKIFNIIKKGIMKVLNAIVGFIIKVKNSISKK